MYDELLRSIEAISDSILEAENNLWVYVKHTLIGEDLIKAMAAYDYLVELNGSLFEGVRHRFGMEVIQLTHNFDRLMAMESGMDE